MRLSENEILFYALHEINSKEKTALWYKIFIRIVNLRFFFLNVVFKGIGFLVCSVRLSFNGIFIYKRYEIILALTE